MSKPLPKELSRMQELAGIKNSRINEADSNNKYSREVNVNIYLYKLYKLNSKKYKGNELNDVISKDKIRLSYFIDVDAREWGIKDISLYGITGDPEIEVEVEYYAGEEDDNIQTETIPIKLDWDKLTIDEQSGEGIVTLGNTLEITLGNDSEGNLIADRMTIDVYTL